jgi:hypothetical protein
LVRVRRDAFRRRMRKRPVGSGSRTWGERELGGGSESLSGFPVC